MHVSEIDTPALVVDLDILDRNLKRVADYTKHHGLNLRPHTKTHKSVRLARRQLELGAAGLTVAKTSESEVMVEAAPPEILIAYPIVGRAKLERLMQVARRTHIIVALDNARVAQCLSEAAQAAQVEVGVLAEFDAGHARVGVPAGAALVELAQSIAKMPNLTFEGVTFFPGHLKHIDETGSHELHELAALVRRVIADLRNAGLAPKIVSGGSTPSLYHSHEIEGVTEIRPGTYVFNDVNTVLSGACGYEDCAASILATVVSTPKPGRMIIDGGSKTFSSDRVINPSDNTFGRLTEAPGARFYNLNEEHGFIDISQAGCDFAIGDRVHVIPNHICVAVNLHEQVYGVRSDEVEEIWKVDGRGKLQ
ncbi:MAG TPA: alanine racemase [Bryobacteraceae bacterium]|nr:alanine racemase [Bryobacteraceae bacterium]